MSGLADGANSKNHSVKAEKINNLPADLMDVAHVRGEAKTGGTRWLLK